MRSAFQRNVDALVKVGDYYYHGLGVPEEPEETRWERAAAFYQSAVDTQVSALAMWNLGWMYENGVGVPRVSYCVLLFSCRITPFPCLCPSYSPIFSLSFSRRL